MELRRVNGRSQQRLDGSLKTISEAALEHVLVSNPGTRVEHRDGRRVAIIPFFDFNGDVSGVHEKEVVPTPVETARGIIPILNVRSGPVANPEGPLHQTPLGKLFRIIGISPPVKKDTPK